jgi:hypothetical protein
VAVVATVAIGGGIRWAIGAAYGWHRARNAPAPSTAQRWILSIAACSAALFVASIVASIASRSFGPSIDEITRAERDALPLVCALYCVDAALVVSTFAAAAARGIDPRWRAVAPDPA